MSKALYRLYNSEVELAFDPEASGHRYIADGVPVPGVTTILNALAKPALVPWAANLSADRFLAICKDVLKHKKVVTAKVLEEASELAKKAHTETRDKAADVGTIVHDFIQHYPGKKVYPDNPVAKAMCEKLVEWYRANVARDLEVEVPVLSRTYGYAGTPDRVIMTKDRQVVILDFKSGKRIYDEAFVQEGFYSFALREEYRVKPEEAWVVNVSKGEYNPETKKVTGVSLTESKLSDRNLPISHIEKSAIQVLNVYKSLQELKNG